ncbi:hypothetical protein [Streptomyces sp. NPDC058812]|uniref:hypothetical protein n=1 Tax=unclassified Streptomyces TaxID=2593676 RepID=UPI0036B0FC55
MADDVTITVHVRDLTGPGFNSVNRNLNQLQRQAGAMGASLRIVGGSLDGLASSASNAGNALGGGSNGLRAKMIGAAAAAGTSLLPTIGALAPMLSGLAVVGGGAALAMDDLKKKAKELKPAFEDWKKAAEKAVAPHTERAVKSLKSAMEDLEPSLVLGAETFGTITERAAKFVDSPVFQSAFQKNAQLGVVFVEQFAESVGKFTQSFLEFGTKSKPALDAWQNLLGGFLDTGLPSMFKELEQGIGGSSDILNGLADFLNGGLLPALGKIAGSFTEAFGPLTRELLELMGQGLLGLATVFEGVMTGMEPVARIAADALGALTDILTIGAEVAGTFASAVGGALFDALLSVMGIDTSGIDDMAGGFTKLSDWVSANEGAIRGAFYAIAHGITSMVTVGVSMLPELWSAFRLTTEAVLLAVDGMVSGMAIAFGNLPVIGDKFKAANEGFDEWAEGFRGTLKDVGGGINSFVDEAVPRLNRAQLTMNVSHAEQALKSIKEKLEDPALTKTRRAQLTAEKKQAEENIAAAKAQLAAFDRSKADATMGADPKAFFGAAAQVSRWKPPKKTSNIHGNTNPFWSAVRGAIGKVLGSSYINVYSRHIDNGVAKPFRSAGGRVQALADGGALQHFPNGGLIEGPGGPRSDSIMATFASGATAMVSDTEYVVQSSAVKKYGLPVLDALNRGTLKLAGGGATKKEREARSKARSDLTLSRFGWMAGWRSSEFGNALGNPDSISSLVSALNQWRSIIQKATSGKTESRLLKQLDSTGKKLMTYERQLTKASSSLQKSKDRLDELRRAASQLRESIMNGVLSASNITKNRGDGPVTPQSIMANLVGSRDKASAFASALQQLQKKGVRSDLIEQIAEAGIDGGGLETASAMLKASAKDIAMMNVLQRQIQDRAISAGRTTSDSVYGSQIKGQEQLVKAWERTVDILGDRMKKLTAAMEKAIEKGFGMKATGGIIGGAASGGARGSWTMVGEHEPELVRLPYGSRVYSGPDTRRMQQQAWTSMLNTPRGGGPRRVPMPAATADGRPIVLNVQIAEREFGQIWVDVGRKQVQTRGGLRATLGGMD